LGDLEDAIKYFRQAVALQPPDHPHHLMSQCNLIDLFSSHFKRLSRIEDLEEAIACSRAVLALRPPGHPHRHTSLVHLAGLIRIRFGQVGRTEDMEEVVRLDSDARNI
jgi:tetratricopeptide (TPR) repeat protein